MKMAPRLLILAFSSIMVVALAPCIGMEFIFPFAGKSTPLQMEIFTRLRMPRVFIAFSAGAGLSLCGMVFQALFRNPLADPFTLGIASGASCGAALTLVLGFTGVLFGLPMVTIGAFLGSICATTLLFGFASYRRTTDKLTMLLAGVALSFLFSSLLMFLQYLSDPHDSYYIIRWLMGGVEAIGYRSLLSMAPLEIIGVVIIFSLMPQLDHLLFDLGCSLMTLLRFPTGKRLQARVALLVEAGLPMVERAAAHVCLSARFGDAPAVFPGLKQKLALLWCGFR